MSLPKVSVQAHPGEAPVVTVDGSPIPGVRSTQIHISTDRMPQVALVLSSETLDVELPAGVTIVRSGATAAEFADQLNPARLEVLALDGGDLDVTTGEAFAAAVRVMAAEFDQAHRD